MDELLRDVQAGDSLGSRDHTLVGNLKESGPEEQRQDTEI